MLARQNCNCKQGRVRAGFTVTGSCGPRSVASGGEWLTVFAYVGEAGVSDPAEQRFIGLRALKHALAARVGDVRHCIPVLSEFWRLPDGVQARYQPVETSMPRKPQVSVEPHQDGRWAVQTDGTQRADSLHDRKSDAVRRGRELAENKQTEVIIKDGRGRIGGSGGKDSHGNDPPRSKG